MFPLLHGILGVRPAGLLDQGEGASYRFVRLPFGASTKGIARTILSARDGASTCGFVTRSGVFYRAPEAPGLCIEPTHGYVFISDSKPGIPRQPSASALLAFLQDSSRRLLVVTPTHALRVDKTAATYRICVGLEREWAEAEFLHHWVADVDPESVLPELMLAYEKRIHCTPTQMWHFWDTFSHILMERRLKLSVKLIPLS